MELAVGLISVLDVVDCTLYRAKRIATKAKVTWLIKLIEFISDLLYTSNAT